MTRPKDIAWNFVIRPKEGRKWRCPYCKNEYSGSVTRVKGHFLKQPKEGIASCTKVPEHIRTLMELLLNNEVHNKEDIAWKFVNRLGENKWRCHHCSEEFFGDLTGVRGHLLKVPTEGITICRKVPDHITKLMPSLFDEEAEEESRGANGQYSTEPQSRHMPAQAEAAEDESREANSQFSTGPQSRERPSHAEVAEEENRDANNFAELLGPLLSAEFLSPNAIEQMVLQLETGTGIGVDSDQQSQPELQFPQSSTMSLLVHSNDVQPVLVPPQHQNAPHQSETRNVLQNPTAPSSTALRDMDLCILSSSQASNAAPQWPTDVPNFNQQDINVLNSGQQSQAERQFHQTSAMLLSVQSSHGESSSCSMMALGEAEAASYFLDVLDQPQCSIRSQMQMNDQQTPAEASSFHNDQLPAVGNSNCLQDGTQHSQLQIPMHSDPSIASQHTIDSHVIEELLAPPMENYTSDQQVQPALLSPQHQCVLHQSINHETRDMQQNATMPLDNRDTTQQPDRHYSLLENLVESRKDCSQPCVVEEVPLLGNTNPTDTVQHPDQLHSRCDKEDGNETHVPSPTPMDIDPSTVDSRVLEVATNTRGPSSSQDMNRGSPIMNVRSIRANDEEIRNLKRKVEELDDKEAVIKEQMEIESAASSARKKPRILVERWLKETERARNNFQIIGQAHAETLPPKEQVETLTREVEELIGQTLPQTLLIEERDAKGVKLLERKLTGEAIHRNIELIWDHLTKNHGCKLGIYGMGGVGKTTIMMHIHNRLLEDATFDGVVFITVSKDFSIYKLQSDIGKALKCGIMKDEDEKNRAAMLSEHLERKKNCVLILDDVWEHLDLEEVGIHVRAHGVKFVLTTRSFDVCRQMQCQEKIKIEPLSRQEAESLFLEELGPEMPLNLEIEAIMKSIVKECAGLPIGVITMARSMRGVTDVFEWRDFLVKLKESSMGQTDMEYKLLMNLKCSYDWLRDPVVQQCFLSCALYPEDESIDKIELIEFFIDQGLIGGLNTMKEKYDRGLTILKRLGNVCLLENHGNKMKMHDLIRDMALHIMSMTSIVKAGKGLTRIPPDKYWTNALEKVSLMENKISEFPLNMSLNCPKLSILLLNSSLEYNVVIPDFFFNQLWGLKVLNLSECLITELPNSISELVNLRALLLRECIFLRRIPCLGKLTSLRKLDARNCISLEALEGLEKLVNLRYLDLAKTRIERLPKGTQDHLRNLQYLEVSAVNEEDITKWGALEKFGSYLKIIDDFNRCVRFIEQSGNSCYYSLLGALEESIFIAEVIDDTRFGNLGRRVGIREWGHAIVRVGEECTGTFILIPRDVQTMRMQNCNSMTNLSSMGLLKYLEELVIEDCKNLGVLCGGQDEDIIDIHDSSAAAPTPLLFPNLSVLDIWDCPKLKYLFGHESKFNLPHLRKIRIRECEEMVGIIAAVTSPPPHPLPSLEEISVESCHKMKRAVESEWMPHLRRIKIFYCGKMEEIIGGPPPYVPVEGISLESLLVKGCNNMRKLFPHEWLPHLRNLQRFEVSDCKGMVEIISGVGQGQEGSITTPVNSTRSSFQPPISLPKLEHLLLFFLPQLKSICEVPIRCDSMKFLSVHSCPELKGIPLQLRLREIGELPYIKVEDKEKWNTLMWDHLDAQAILQPYLQKWHFYHFEFIGYEFN